MRLPHNRRPRIDKLERKGRVERLVRALSYEDPVIDRDGRLVDFGVGTRIAAVDALGRLDAPTAHDGLLRALADPEPSVREAAVRALADRGDLPALDALSSAVASWRAPGLEDAREAAAAALAALDDPEGARRLAHALLEDSQELDDQDVTIVRKLGGANDGQALTATIDDLVGRLRDEPERAGRLLARLAPDSIPRLLDVLDDPVAQQAGILALGTAHDSRAVDPLCHLLQTSERPAIRRSAAWALGEIKDPAAVESLLVATADADYAVRDEASKSFDKLGNVAVAIAMSAMVRSAIGDGASSAPGETLQEAMGRVPPVTFTSPRQVRPTLGQRTAPIWRRLLGSSTRP